VGQADHLDFELPFTSKFLLLAAYVCSRNKASLDRRLFDPSSRGCGRRGALASDKQVHILISYHSEHVRALLKSSTNWTSQLLSC
jgi:hypothetical protein